MNILVIGGGIAGISAAKVALKGGLSVTIVEAAPEPGGLMTRIANCRIGFRTFFDEIRENRRLTLLTGTRITGVTGAGDGYAVATDTGRVIDADRVVVATGLVPYQPAEGSGKRVLTSLEYDALIDQRNGDLPADFDRVAFILCVGSRCLEYPLCSSVCCSYTLREIKWTLQRAHAGLTVFYNDLRFFGQEFYMERLFREAGVAFVRASSRYFEEDETGVTVRYFARSTERGALQLRGPHHGAAAESGSSSSLSRLFGFSLNGHGFVKEKAPLTTDAPNVFAAGGSLEPMNVKDSILTGFGAGMLSARGETWLSDAAARRTSVSSGKRRRNRRAGRRFYLLSFLYGLGKARRKPFLRVHLRPFSGNGAPTRPVREKGLRGNARHGVPVVRGAGLRGDAPSRCGIRPSGGRREHCFRGARARVSGTRWLVLEADRIIRFDDYEGLFRAERSFPSAGLSRRAPLESHAVGQEEIPRGLRETPAGKKMGTERGARCLRGNAPR